MGSFAVKTMVLVAVIVLGSKVELSTSTTSLTDECGPAIQKVTSCLSFATGKAVEPSKDCCDAVTGIRAQQPVCLCFFIGQAHNGTQQIKSLGIQEPKLLQLPSACHLNKVNMTKCPELLGISPSSPAAAVFMNTNLTSPSTSSSSTSARPTAGAGNNKSSGSKHEIGSLVFVVFLSLLI